MRGLRTHPTFQVPDGGEEEDQEEAEDRPADHKEQRLLHDDAGRELRGLLGAGPGPDEELLHHGHHLAPPRPVPGVDQEGDRLGGVDAGELEPGLVAGHVPQQGPGLGHVDLQQSPSVSQPSGDICEGKMLSEKYSERIRSGKSGNDVSSI